MITISLFYYYKKMFIHTNAWVIGKSSMKKHFPNVMQLKGVQKLINLYGWPMSH